MYHRLNFVAFKTALYNQIAHLATQVYTRNLLLSQNEFLQFAKALFVNFSVKLFYS